MNYIYGTALVLRGLEAIGMDNHEPCIQQAAEWLRMVQNPDGGWGESCRLLRRSQPCAASAKARLRKPHGRFLDILAVGDTRSDSVARGIAYLLRTQKEDGSWDEPSSPAPVFRACSI